MNCKSKLAILALVAKVFAAEFAVVSFEGACQLSLGGNTVQMTADPACPNLYKATADAQDGATYKYVCGGKEDVERTLKGGKTHNELFGRALTVSDMFEFGYPTSDVSEPWTRSIGRTELFDPTYVPTVIIDAGKDFFVKGSGSTTANKMTFILKDSVHTFDKVSISAKNNEQDKFQMKFDLPGTGIYNRTGFKFRPSSEDPVFIRQILYGDILHAIGNPTHESVAARVYLKDGTKVALYVLQEDVTTESFVKSAFLGNPDGSLKSNEPQTVHDCSTGADFTAKDRALYGFTNTETSTKLYELMAKIDATNPTDQAAVKDLNDNWFDMNIFLKAAALEYLAGHWDSYWFLTTNFAVYAPPNEKYFFIDQDFDQTWSVGMKESLDPQNFPTKPYTEYVNAAWKTINSDQGSDESGHRYLIEKFLGCDGAPTCPTKDLFESHLKSIVQHIFNPVAIQAKVDSYRTRLDEEMKWDLESPNMHTGSYSTRPEKAEEYYHFTYDDWVSGFNAGPNSLYGIINWTETIANTVCNQYQIQYDKTPLTPETAAKAKVEPAKPGEQENVLKTNNTQSSSGSITSSANVALAVIATLLSIVLYL
ncbi:hypothetical protein BCR32DRAFT_273292 [Anaeromyces robustus]|jgi:hypothetical protein|uniref:Coth-domain-containing protein n=1 Tax=Anaeromyces robustus TaxID=1754192 RepID=A0A1Y1VRI9_9FUNG|nr:hypothetical protein BCR32DRAFT_273292 [Anaeromyces robustus]|eukprot:ORX63912.1 hypothetical protein BCR32DRAFT_273292 [Anaeromyces robustus]